MTVAHIMGIPVEETFAQLAPFVAVTVAVVAIVGRTTLVRVRNRIRRR
jgi:hypothetical protein